MQKMKMLVSNLYWRRKKSILPFEYGILGNIKSTRNLLMDLKGKGYQYLMISRMNSNGVENMFSCTDIILIIEYVLIVKQLKN